jgi:hypothetical protein
MPRSHIFSNGVRTGSAHNGRQRGNGDDHFRRLASLKPNRHYLLRTAGTGRIHYDIYGLAAPRK